MYLDLVAWMQKRFFIY